MRLEKNNEKSERDWRASQERPSLRSQAWWLSGGFARRSSSRATLAGDATDGHPRAP